MNAAHRRKGRSKNSTFEFDSSVANGVADQGFHYRGDARAVSSFANVAPRKRTRTALEESEDTADPYSDWVDAPADNGEFANIASTFCSNDTYEHFIEEDEVKRKRYTSSDDPMKLWRDTKHLFLDHLIRRDGLGDYHQRPRCSLCDAEYIEGSSARLFRCEACGEFLQCMTCLEDRHRLNPLHCVKVRVEWNGAFWENAALHRLHVRDQSTQSLNFVYQLGHHGQRCIRPASTTAHTMVVMDVRGVFSLRVRFCGCEKALRQDPVAQLMANGWYPATTIDPATCATFACLEQFRLLNVVGNLSAHDYVGILRYVSSLKTYCLAFLTEAQDRYKAFGRMSRQYQFLKRSKRAGVGHDMARMDLVKPGGLAVRCWACPTVGFNLPDGWDTCKKEDEYLYALMLALDANFRLKNRMRTNEKHDPSLGPGWGCFVETEAYKEHLRDYVAEVDVSTCIAFAALMQKETRLTTGLRVSGVGGCVCARHGVVRAQGIGDLQKGERYANMDYILLHALGDTRVKELVFSYDIACQWKQHLRERVLAIANEHGVLPNLSNFNIQFALPVWHAAAHEVNCQAAMSLSHATGVGRTDGEGIERTWATLNPISYATKEMGEGNRHDSIEDKIDHISFEKNVGQETELTRRVGDTLARKLVIAVAERDKQIREFVDIDRGLEPSLRREWQKGVDDWVADRSKPNPYVMAGGKDVGPSEAQVAADLRKAEVEEAREGRGDFVDGTTTATSFIKGLLQLEDLKRRIKHEVRGSTTLTADRSSQIDELRATFFKKLNSIQRQQDVFMPGVAGLRAAEEERRDGELPAPKAEDVKLWLPSDLTQLQRSWACKASLREVEAKLRQAQCNDALVKIRAQLYTKTHLIHTRNAMAVGQAATTRSSTLIAQVGDRTQRETTKYTQAWTALRKLKGKEYAPELKELQTSDLHVRTETESDARARLRLGRLGEARRGRNEPTATTTEGSKGVSWIWSAVREEDDEVGLHEAVRVHWAKALARRDRWVEEVRLLREERTRVLRSLLAIQTEWTNRLASRPDAEPRLEAGLKAYARRQVAVHRKVAESFYRSWHVNVKAALQEVLGLDGELHRQLLFAGQVREVDGSVVELEGPEEGIAEGTGEVGAGREGGDTNASCS
ncbi:hypothetical protein C8F01DRAFT_1208404 [Mycena amicta]|nr:hypothetical protein C8F01DRAFT_1208404 [Mycena amicta]